MAPAPNLQDLIETVERDAPASDVLTLLGTASSVVADIQEVGDALLGHFVDRCRRHGHSWSEISTALGVSKQAAHKRFSSPAPTLERFTPRARRTTDAASASARALGHNFVGTEHILLGLFADPEALAARVLAEAGIDRAAVEAKVLEALPRGEGLLDNPLYIPQASHALQNALREALELGHNYIGTAHILLALLRHGDAPAGRILAELGVRLPSARSRLLEMVNVAAGKAGPRSGPGSSATLGVS